MIKSGHPPTDPLKKIKKSLTYSPYDDDMGFDSRKTKKSRKI
jgi:hypothetical protein